ncbi:hypothetical protein [Mesorhizobium sp. L-8-10]|uniref:hypothetical protein n=2 Tax=unclassified Mesorhizobium TaxID=325217 RepID=UPI001926F5EB|nr:hypothetical protein [Mesorhizobium sp. L-8-10]
MGRILAYSTTGKLLFAALFLVLSSLQPGLFAAANATGFHADGGIRMSVEQPHTHAGDVDHAEHGTVAADHDQQAQKHHHSEGAKNKSCETHCAPVLAVPVDCPVLGEPSARCFAPAMASPLPLGEYAEFIQPPRRLI